MESNSQDRNLPASERKLRQARTDGQASRSKDLSHLAVLGTGSVALLVLAPVFFDRLKLALTQQFSFNADTLAHNGTMLDRLQQMSAIGLVASVVFAAIVLAAAVVSAVSAGGWVAASNPSRRT